MTKIFRFLPAVLATAAVVAATPASADILAGVQQFAELPGTVNALDGMAAPLILAQATLDIVVVERPAWQVELTCADAGQPPGRRSACRVIRNGTCAIYLAEDLPASRKAELRAEWRRQC